MISYKHIGYSIQTHHVKKCLPRLHPAMNLCVQPEAKDKPRLFSSSDRRFRAARHTMAHPPSREWARPRHQGHDSYTCSLPISSNTFIINNTCHLIVHQLDRPAYAHSSARSPHKGLSRIRTCTSQSLLNFRHAYGRNLPSILSASHHTFPSTCLPPP